MSLFFLSLGAFTSVWAQERALEPALEEFLIAQEAEVEKGDLVLKGSLVAIIPSSQRLIVKTEEREEEKTLALALSNGVRIKEKLNVLEAGDLQRGDVLVMILQSDSYEVKEIHKYDASK